MEGPAALARLFETVYRCLLEKKPLHLTNDCNKEIYMQCSTFMQTAIKKRVGIKKGKIFSLFK